MLGFWQQYRFKLQEARSSALLLQFVDRLFEYPFLSIPAAARFLKVTHRSGAQLIGRLVGAGILTEVTGRERNRLNATKEVIDSIESAVVVEKR
jgi:hypothetical protein